jgi:hypothetical protein
VYAIRNLIVSLILLSTAGCVTHLPRYADPARLDGIALGASDASPDLLVIDVVWSVELKDEKHFLIAVPHAGPPTLPLELRDSKCKELSRRERLFLERNTEHWRAERRLHEDLALPSDLPPDQRRSYSMRSVRDAAGHFDLEFTRRQGGADEELGSVRLPSECTPGRVAPIWLYLAAVPLAAFDLAALSISVVALVLLLPFGSFAIFEDMDVR